MHCWELASRTCVRKCPAQGPYPFNPRRRCSAAIQGEVLRSAIMIRMLEVGISSPRWLALLASAGYLETILNEAAHVRRFPCQHCCWKLCEPPALQAGCMLLCLCLVCKRASGRGCTCACTCASRAAAECLAEY